MQDKLLMLFKFWWGLCLLMCIFVLIYHIHFTVKFSYTPISHILVISNVWFGPDYFHRFSSNEIRAYKIELEYLSAVQDPEPLCG